MILKSRRLWISGLVVGLFALYLVPAAAQGAIALTKWEAVICKENKDIPTTLGEAGTELGYEDEPGELPPPPEQCTESTAGKWFTQAAGHPNWGITNFRLFTAPHPPLEIGGFPTAFPKEIVVNTPEGLSVNPEAAPQCTVAQLVTLACPPAAQVGTNYLTVAAQSPAGEPPKCAPAGECLQARVALPVYNLVPFEGVPSMVGFLTKAGPTFIVGSLDPVDQHVIFTIDVHPPSALSPPIIESRLVFNGKAGDGTYLTTPSNCAGGQTTTVHMVSQGPPYEAEETETEASFTTAVGASGCELVPFKPTIDVAPQGGAVDSPEATNVTVSIPFEPTSPIANSYLKDALVTLPEGMGLNPASANGLVACTDAQFAKGTDDPIACPDASKVGTVAVQTPSLPADSLTGTVYIGQPLSNEASSGEQFRIFIHAGSDRYGVNVRLVGHVFPNLSTGQLTVRVPDNPQATFSSFKLKMFGGSRGTLTSPPTCGPHTTSSVMTPWSENADENEPSNSFTLTSDPSTGGACPNTLGERRFVPDYTTKSDSSTANAFSPFHVHIGRVDGEQELKVADVTLPAGLSGNIADVPYCSDSEIAAAASKSGAAEQASPSCPAASQIGTSTTAAGTGNSPIKVNGAAYLAGPYKGAPLSMAVITPGVAGPYDIGTVVVRVALNVDPESTRISANSDVIPDVVDGVKLDIRALDVDLNRSGFMHNPTNCDAKAVTGTLHGGGSNPADPAAFSSYPFSAPYLTTECDKLAFKPKLGVKLLGGKKSTKRRGHPPIQAVLTTRSADANVSRTALVLPQTMLLDNAHIKTICTRVQLAAQQCPDAAVYGHATASSPLLAGDLSGPVYLTSSSHKLPDLVADLRGQVNVQLRGVISTVKGGMKTVFNAPDAPVSKFVLKMEGGSKGLIINSKNLCKGKKSRQAKLNMKGQNGKKVENNKFKIKASCGKKKKK
jgi:hypothetical protein